MIMRTRRLEIIEYQVGIYLVGFCPYMSFTLFKLIHLQAHSL